MDPVSAAVGQLPRVTHGAALWPLRSQHPHVTIPIIGSSCPALWQCSGSPAFGAGVTTLFGLGCHHDVSYQVTTIPTFILSAGWVNTLYPSSSRTVDLLHIPAASVHDGRAHGDGFEAATLDGCSPIGVYWRVMLPMSKPALATVAIFSFMNHWNDLMTPLIYLNSRRLYTISLGLATFRQQYSTETPWHLLMAASVVTMMPPLIIFFLAQRLFIQGLWLLG